MNLRFDPARDLKVRESSPPRNIRIIEIVPEQIVTKEICLPPKVYQGDVVSDPARDLLKLVVVERHRATGNIGIGFVRGFQLRTGALGSTVAHDAHNVVVVGVSDVDIALAIRELEIMRGGQVAVAQGKVKAALPLPIAGLVSDRPLDEVMRGVSALNEAAREMGCLIEAPFMTLSFLSLSPDPRIEINRSRFD